MKKLFVLSIVLLIAGSPLMAQSTYSEYFITTSQTRSSLNPAFRPKQGYIGVPFLSNIFIDAKTNSLNLDHLTFLKEGSVVSFLHPSVGTDEFLSGMDENNYLSVDANYRIASVGFYDKKEGFWTIDLGVRAISDANIPKSLFDIAKRGFSADENDVLEYRINDVKANASAYLELGGGYSRPLLENSLLVGAKAKVLLGLANLNLNLEQFNASVGHDKWVVRSKATLDASLPGGVTPTYDEDGIFDGIENGDGFGLSGFGLGLDLGAVYHFKNLSESISNESMQTVLGRLQASLAFTDIGFISWKGGNSMKLSTPDHEIVVAPGDRIISGAMDDYFDDIINDFEEAINFKEAAGKGGKSTALYTTMNVGLEYEAWVNNLSVGLLSSTKFVNSRTMAEFTLSGNYNPEKVKWLAATLSYSFMHNKFNSIGLALHLTPSKGINFFIASDYWIPKTNKEFLPATTNAMNIQFGLSIPMGDVR